MSAPAIQLFLYGKWLFNIDQAQALLKEHPRDAKPTPVADWAAAYHLDRLTPDYDGARWCPVFGPDQSAFNAERALQTDLNKPVIIATLEFDGRPAVLLIDGVHRMYRAMTECRATLPAHTLTTAETARIRER
ncbi:hypothetical protein [Streptomyces lydicus]|uniref:hypothetical protein n=1 Tax=Streptomyces lydicus TaxID=47763 RepID=UPI001012592E|nr:hypothetical protein [Streptomyces lydicus]MCZ1012017.1 hypothetical protein [Streptomyces lydicus]